MEYYNFSVEALWHIYSVFVTLLSGRPLTREQVEDMNDIDPDILTLSLEDIGYDIEEVSRELINLNFVPSMTPFLQHLVLFYDTYYDTLQMDGLPTHVLPYLYLYRDMQADLNDNNMRHGRNFDPPTARNKITQQMRLHPRYRNIIYRYRPVNPQLVFPPRRVRHRG